MAITFLQELKVGDAVDMTFRSFAVGSLHSRQIGSNGIVERAQASTSGRRIYGDGMTSLDISGGPDRHVERRSTSFTDVVVAGLLSRASGTAAVPDTLGALEVASGLWARSFAVASVSPVSGVTASLTPSWRGDVARALCRRGESLHVIDVDGGGDVRLHPASDWTVRGSSTDETAWWYEVTLATPDGTTVRAVPSAGVVHCRYATDARAPWVGLSPLQYAVTTGTLGAALEQALAHESAGPTGSFLPVPRLDGEGDEDDVLALLQADITNLKGKAALVESVASGWAEGKQAAPQSDWTQKRLGAAPPDSLIALRDSVTTSVLSCCGIPPSLFASGAAAQREGLRTFFRSTCLPVAEIISAELTTKLDVAVRFDFKSLAAADVSTAARALASLVKSGVPVAEARELVGLE